MIYYGLFSKTIQAHGRQPKINIIVHLTIRTYSDICYIKYSAVPFWSVYLFAFRSMVISHHGDSSEYKRYGTKKHMKTK